MNLLGLRGSRFVAAILLTLLAALAGLGLAEAADAPGRTPLPAIERAKSGATCIAEPAVMRRDHMKLLKHQRDITVHRGERDGRDSLQGCIGCHASKTTGSVAAAPTDFCSSCHAYAAVRIDCFECHSSRPATAQAALSGVAR
jgi:hypothetical protein